MKQPLRNKDNRIDTAVSNTVDVVSVEPLQADESTEIMEAQAQPGEKPGCIAISVRTLVEFLLRSGNIDNRRKGGGRDTELMLEGANAHRMIQRSQGSEYRSEVMLRDVIMREGYDIIVEGRADGIIYGETIIIDEIKSSHKELRFIKAPDPVHLAQAKCYAYMYASQNNLSSITVRMTYVNLTDHDYKYFYEDYTIEEITKWYTDLLEQFYKWADFSYYWKGVRNRSIEGLKFPFVYRTGQRELIGQVYKSLTSQQKLFIQAPTGVGKTIASMYPALKAMGEGRCEKIFYLTAKTITRTVASDCLKLLREQPFSFKSVVITARDKICPLENPECNPDVCAYAKGHYDRINDALYELLTESDNCSREDVEAISLKHRVCPFELNLDMTLFADAVICDYNYVFDPNVYLKRFFADGIKGNYYFLVDEAHNLVDRAMEMYSAQLIKEEFLEVRRIVKEKDEALGRHLNKINKIFLEYKRGCEDVEVLDSIDTLILSLDRLYGRLEDFLDTFDHFDEREVVLNFFFEVRHFINMFENMGKNDYVCYAQLLEDGRFMIKLLCADPSDSLKRCYDRSLSTLLFSATLLPIKYYKQMLGGMSHDPAVYAQSVFDPARRGLFVARDVTSKYTRRGYDEYARMARYISEIVSKRSGNYLIFLPSHAMLDQVFDIYTDLYYEENQEYVIQSSSMGETEREEFISRFENNVRESGKTLLGFCVLGGIFSEGIDLKRDALIGTIIIGTGLPMVAQERNLLKERYSESGYDGFAYAYRYPGMNKVLQAAGRVIRTAEDIGIVALLDERFLMREYMSMFPREWENYMPVTVDTVGDAIESFWKNHVES